MTFLSRLAGRRPTGDDGVALVVAVAVAGLVAILCVTLVTITIAETRGSGRERQRAEAVQFAEGQVDTTMARIQSSAPTTLPCTGTGQSAVSGPDVIDADTTVTYYDATGAPVACSATTGPAGEVTSALVSTTATSQALAGAAPAERTVETLVNLTPTVEIDGMDKAIFGNSGINLSSNGEVFGQDGIPDADLYTNGNFSCDNNQEYHGSIYAQGQITLASTCTVDVDAWAGTGFTADNTGVTVKGDVKVGNGNAVMTKKGVTVAGTVTTSGVITGDAWRGENCPAKCTQGASPGMPPQQDFPQLLWDATEWANAEVEKGGPYVAVFADNDCTVSGTGNGPGRWILEKAPGLTEPTVLLTDCKVEIQKNGNEIELSDNLAVFAKGGFSLKNSIKILSTDPAQPRYLYFIQPYDAVASPCGSNGISLGNQVDLQTSVNLLMYTPCNLVKENNTSHFGQIYAGGTATVKNSLTMYYKPLPVWGIANAQPVLTGYTLDVVYKRENIG